MGPPVKSAAAFRTISEVSADLSVPQHVLRFWETKFAQVKPLKRGGGRRYYRPEDITLLGRIRSLLYEQGYTIRGVQRLLGQERSTLPRPDLGGELAGGARGSPAWEVAISEAVMGGRSAAARSAVIARPLGQSEVTVPPLEVLLQDSVPPVCLMVGSPPHTRPEEKLVPQSWQPSPTSLSLPHRTSIEKSLEELRELRSLLASVTRGEGSEAGSG